MKIYGETIPNIPWEAKPKDCSDVVWRSAVNPVIDNKKVFMADRIYNSGVVPFNSGFAGVFRVDDKTKGPHLRVGFSKDGLNWDINDKKIEFEGDFDAIRGRYEYDPRVVFIEDRYYVTWCNSMSYGSSIGVAFTFDFKVFHRLENAFLPQNRNGVLFPRKIGGKYMMLSRPSDSGHCPTGNIFISESPDLTYWGKHRFLLGTAPGWQGGKVGAGPIPIETDEGWLVIYHGTNQSCNGYIYSCGAALLDREDPTKVLHRGGAFLLAPETDYERVGEVGNVVFPCAALCDSETGRLAIYYGAADTVLCMAYSYVDDIINYIKKYDIANN